jgi:hypothetical protein
MSGVKDELPDLSGLMTPAPAPAPIPWGALATGSPKFEVGPNAAASMPRTGDYMSKVGGASDVPVQQDLSGSGGGAPTGGAISRDQVREARANGYSDEDIARHLVKKSGKTDQQYEAAIGQGHSSQQIIDYFSPPDMTDRLAPVDAFMRSAAETIPFDPAGKLEKAFSKPEDIVIRKSEQAQHPIASKAGTVAGTLAPAAVGGPVWAQSALYGALGGAGAAERGIEAGETPGQIAGRTAVGAVTGAVVPAALSGVAAVAGKGAQSLREALPGGEAAAKSRMASEIIQREANKTGETFETVAKRLGTEVQAGAQSPVEGVQRTLATAVPENATVAQAYNSAAAKRGTVAADELAQQGERNQQAVVSHVQNLDPREALVKAQADLDQKAAEMYDKARANYEPNTPNDLQTQHAVVMSGLVETNKYARDAFVKAQGAINDETGLAQVAKQRAAQISQATGQPVEPTFTLRPGTGSPVDLLHRTRQFIDQTIKENPASKQDNVQRILARKAIDDQMAHMSPEFKAADEMYKTGIGNIKQLEAAQGASQQAAPEHALNIQHRSLGRAVENVKGELHPEVQAQFDNALEELRRQQVSAKLGNGPGSATAGRISEAAKGAIGDIGTIAAADMIAGGHVGGPLILANKVVSGLSSAKQQKAAADLFLNPKSTGELFSQLGASDKHAVMQAVKNIANAAAAGGAGSNVVQDQLLNLWPQQ